MGTWDHHRELIVATMGQSPTRSRLAVEKSPYFRPGIAILGRNINMFWVQLVVKNDANSDDQQADCRWRQLGVGSGRLI